MTAPRHLWSGDWRRESADAAEKLAERRGPTNVPADLPPTGPAPAHPSARARVLGALRNATGRRFRAVILIGVPTLLSAVAAYGAVSALVASRVQNSAPARQPPGVSGAPAWLGVKTTSVPLANGAMIVNVAPGSPADAAGLQRGDVITEVDDHSTQTPGGLESTLAGLHPGQQVQIAYERGSSAGTYTTRATLQARPNAP